MEQSWSWHWADDKLVAVCDNKGLITEHILQAEIFHIGNFSFPEKIQIELIREGKSEK